MVGAAAMAVVVATAAAAVVVGVRLGDVLAEFPASAPHAGSNASAVSEAIRLDNT
jgi:hypothetical protein